MTYNVLIPYPNNINISRHWLEDHFGGPVEIILNKKAKTIHEYCIGCSGPTWRVSLGTLGTNGAFQNKEDAVLFQLSWL